MENRLLKCTENYRREEKKFFCAFLTLGYPSLAATSRLIRVFEKSGVDIIELGFPFSDPLADGPTIQFSSEQALKNKISVEDAFSTVSRLRKEGVLLPILFFSYFNPILHYGTRKFVQHAARAGFDGVVIPDLPPDEEKEFSAELKKNAMCPVYLIAPTTSEEREKMIARQSQGFIYYVSLRGVTGARSTLSTDIQAHIRRIKKNTEKPVLVGFGVSSPEQAARLSGFSDGVIVGSAIIEKIRSADGRTEGAEKFIVDMVAAVKGKRNVRNARN